MTSFGLALGGGGIVGVAWEVGVLSALSEAGFDPAAAQVLVGTSAGSIIGSRLLLGHPLEQLVEEQHREGGGPGGPPPDLALLMEVFQLWTSQESMTEELARKVATRALEASGMPEDDWVGFLAETVGTEDWPAGDLRVTAVSCETGERVAWTAASLVPLSRAVASSCAIPGMVPPVTIGADRYVDGGLWSGSNADLLVGTGSEAAVFIGPMSGARSLLGRLSAATLATEGEAVAASGLTLHAVTPGPDFAPLSANLMDPSQKEAALAAGRADGRQAAGRLAGVLGF